MRIQDIMIEYRASSDEAGALPEEGKTFAIWFSSAELAALQAKYDADSSTSPSVSDARPVLRALLDAEREG